MVMQACEALTPNVAVPPAASAQQLCNSDATCSYNDRARPQQYPFDHLPCSLQFTPSIVVPAGSDCDTVAATARSAECIS